METPEDRLEGGVVLSDETAGSVEGAVTGEAFELSKVGGGAGVRRSLVVVSPDVADYQTLLQGLAPGSELLVLDPVRDGLGQVAELLSQRTGETRFSTIHLLSHGSPGSLQLGATALSASTLDAHLAILQAWSAGLTDDADLLIYGCNVAQGPGGEDFLARLAQATGADVAASDDLTGAAALGGDWVLERQVGSIENDPVRVENDWQQVLGASSFDLSTLNGTNGFRLDGAKPFDHSGCSVNSAGDVNGDGFADLIIGADDADPGRSGSGASYVIFGRAGSWAAATGLSSLDGSNGFRLDGVAAGDRSGCSVSGAGDVNGDGYDDLIIGAKHADLNGPSSGASYVVFGRAGGFASAIDLSMLDGANGFRLDGATTSYQLDGGVAYHSQSGASVSGAGDINGDGFADLAVREQPLFICFISPARCLAIW